MFRKAISLSGLLLLAGAVVLVTPGFGQARGGGGHFGGGGFHGGGAHFGGFRGGVAHYGGYRGGFYGHAYSHYGYGGYYPFYGAGYYDYPSLGYSNDSYDPYYYSLPPVTGASGYYGTSGDTTSSYPAGGSPSLVPFASSRTDTSARVTVSVPAGARVTFDGVPTASAGAVREFDSPPLTPGRQYTYDVKATWDDNGKEVTQTKQVEITAGAHVNVAFPSSAKSQASAVTGD